MQVTADTLPDLDRDLPSYPVTGELVTRKVATLAYTQYLVDGWDVDPKSVRPLVKSTDNAFCPGKYRDPSCSPGSKQTYKTGDELRRSKPGIKGADVLRDRWLPAIPDGANKRVWFGTKVSEVIDDSPDLNDQQRKDYKEAFLSVMDKLPTKAVEALVSQAKGFAFYETSESLTDTFNRTSGPEHQAPPGAVGGYYDRKLQKYALDGVIKMRQEGIVSPGTEDIASVYAHELTHAVDHHYKLSSTDGWLHAAEREIVGNPYAPARLSEYARSTPHEAFAEFGRVLYGPEANPERVERLMPQCSAFFKDHGLWPRTKKQN